MDGGSLLTLVLIKYVICAGSWGGDYVRTSSTSLTCLFNNLSEEVRPLSEQPRDVSGVSGARVRVWRC